MIWLNGAFGSGKSTVAQILVERHGGWRLFDPEVVGYMLKAQLADQPFTDFQHWLAWRRLVAPTAAAIADQTGQSLVMVQTVTDASIWTELAASMEANHLEVAHIVLACDPAELRRRIERDTIEAGARQWRLDHIDAFEAALVWLNERADAVIDTTHLVPVQVADRVLAAAA